MFNASLEAPRRDDEIAKNPSRSAGFYGLPTARYG